MGSCLGLGEACPAAGSSCEGRPKGVGDFTVDSAGAGCTISGKRVACTGGLRGVGWVELDRQ
jgi:hypothetical protein